MKGKNPTREQRKLLIQRGLNTLEWLVQKDTSTSMQLVHRKTGEEMLLVKEGV